MGARRAASDLDLDSAHRSGGPARTVAIAARDPVSVSCEAAIVLATLPHEGAKVAEDNAFKKAAQDARKRVEH